jgi:hypothetical protein
MEALILPAFAYQLLGSKSVFFLPDNGQWRIDNRQWA